MTAETRIITRVLAGDVDCFRHLVERYQMPIIRMISNIVPDSHMCQDLAQDVFLTAYKKLSSFDPARSDFSTWLFAIARNQSINALKKRPISSPELPEKPDSHQPYTNLAEKEFFVQLDRALADLPPKQKTAFVLAEFENLTYQQIAQIEGVRIGTVRSRISRAKQKLRSALKDLAGGDA